MVSEFSNQQSKYKISNPVLWIIYLIAYLSMELLPSVKYSVPYIIAGLFAMLPMAIISMRRIEYRIILCILVVLGFVQGLITFITGNGAVTELINEPIRSVRFFVPCVLFEIVSKMGRKKQLIVWSVCSFIIGFVIIKTLIAVSTNPMIARILAQGALDDELMAYRRDNIGGFGFCYAACLTFGMWAFLMLKTKLWMRVVSIGMMIFLVSFALQVQYMTMLLLCIAAFLFTILFCAKKPTTKILSVGIVLICLMFLPIFLRWLASFNVGGEIYGKIMNIANTLEGNQSLSNSTSRVELYKAALIDFIKSPLWGTFGSTAVGTSHSTFLGIAAASGLIGLCAYSYGVYKCYDVTAKNLKILNVKNNYKMIFIVFIILAVVNPVHYIYEISIVLLLYIPLTFLLFSKDERLSNDEKKNI